MPSRTVGLIGGVGPGSTAVFYQDVVQRYGARRGGDQPGLLLYSVPMGAAMETDILNGATSGPAVDRLLEMLADGVDRLARAGADAIAMPCNTLQAYLPAIVARANLPYIHLIHETVRRARRQGRRRVAVLCTSPMRALGLYQAELAAQAVPYRLPTDAEQAELTQVILATLHGQPDPSARLRPLVRRLETEADSLLLGCSDLTAFADPGFTTLPVIDAMDVLADATVDYLLQ